ncbi:MAG: bifunctional glutamate N-acetyltransferase/amino-acid acetyltransferase ArgJ [bacterium]
MAEHKRKSAVGPGAAPKPDSILVPGFRAAGIHAGIKKNGARDLVLVTADPPARVAGLFTQNRVQAAPVVISRSRIRCGLCQAVLVNSGNANACTGEPGLRDALALSQALAGRLGIEEESLLVASTGVVGERLPAANIRKALPALVRSLRADGLLDAAEAIRTTDAFPKLAWRQSVIGGETVTLFGMAKGAGMICPNMATMLAFFLTDLNAPAAALRKLLRTGAARSFNRIDVDGDASTNDTLLLLANGRAGHRAAAIGTRAYDAFAELLFPMMEELAGMIVKDGEGATKLVEIRVQGARSAHEARVLAYKLAGSPLVKTSFYGQDLNWGRLMVALGCAGPAFRPGLVDISYDGRAVVRKGVSAGRKAEERARPILRKDRFALCIDLHAGKGAHTVLTTDLSHAYVTLNASYRT